MKKAALAKEKIFDAAVFLFNAKGYAETSIRDIASRAGANIATISYYFNGKEGLLEYSFITFFEPYLETLEEQVEKLEEKGAVQCLKDTIQGLMEFQHTHFHLTRFVLREVSIERQIVRELMSTYLMKERYLLQKILRYGMEKGELRRVSPGMCIIQLRSLMTMPFLNSIYTSEVWNVHLQDRFYFEKYKEQLYDWVDAFLVNKKSGSPNT